MCMLTILAAKESSAQCFVCTTGRTATCEYNGTGGCGCRSGFNGRYYVCATCGFCSFNTCLYGCGASASPAPATVKATVNPWASSLALPVRLRLQSPDMASIVEFAQSGAKTCTNLNGHSVDVDGNAFDWAMLTNTAGTTFSIKGTHQEVLKLSGGSWALLRDGKAVTAERY